MRSKVFSLLVVLALLLGTFGTAFAQDMAEPFCGDLSADDCAMLQDAQAAMAEVSSYTADGSYQAVIAGIPGLPADEIDVNVNVGGSVAVDEAAAAAAQAVQGKDQMALMNDLAADPQPLVDLVNGMSLDLTLSADMTPELADALSAQAGVAIPASSSVGLILVDGVLYADLSAFADLGAPAGWIGVPVGELVQSAIDTGAFEQAAAQMDPSQLDPGTAAVLGMQGMLMGDLSQFEQFLTVEKSEGDAGQAIFTTTFDVTSFVSSPEFSDMLLALADAGALEGTGLTKADLEANLPMVGMMAPMLFADLLIDSQVTVDTENMLVTNNSSEVSWDLAGLLQMAAMSGALPAEIDASAPMAVSFMTSMDYADFDNAPAVEAPADAMMIPVEALMGQPAQ